MIGGLRRALVALLGGQSPPPPAPRSEEPGEPSERFDAAKQRLKDRIPPPEED